MLHYTYPINSLCVSSITEVILRDGGGVVSQEDIDNHNKEGGYWIILHGKVYDIEPLAMQVGRIDIHW